MKLFASILKEHGSVTQENIKKDIFNNNLLAASNDPYKRFKANEENNRIFSDPNTLNVFGENGLMGGFNFEGMKYSKIKS